ncbi:T9SS type A sorting domain-containing protein [Flavobacteriaceae bacterium LMO-SS05]|jgi:hypothetical protein
MKKIYFLFLLTLLFSINYTNAQCPDNAYIVGAQPDQQVIFTFDPGPGPDCSTRPSGIQLDGTTVYSKGDCGSNYVIYNFVFGPAISDPNNFSVDYDGSTCNYTNNILPVEVFQMINNASLKVYPNPISRNNKLNVNFALNSSAKINVYNVTGKLMISDKMNNLKSKSFNISNLTGGIYFLKIETDNSSTTRKIVVLN